MPDWQVILSRDGPVAWKAAYRLLGNQADTDDCFQEACLAALEVSRREEVHNWPGLLVRLAIARSIDRLRAKQRVQKRTVLTGLEFISDVRASPLEDPRRMNWSASSAGPWHTFPPSRQRRSAFTVWKIAVTSRSPSS